MYLEIEDKMLNKIKEITNTNYEEKGNYIPAKNITSIIEDLLYEIDVLKEEFEDYKDYVEDNYKPISQKEMYDIYEDVF